jgi:hypothetical protein
MRSRHSRAALRAIGASFLLLGLAPLWTSGCEGGEPPLCKAQCDCMGCGMRERQDCVDDVEDAERNAANEGCSAQFSDYVTCFAGRTCSDNGTFTTSCDIQGEALEKCSSLAGKIVRTTCEDARDKFISCGLGGFQVSPCAPQSACVARCALAATCSDLQTQPSNGPFVTCANNCQ